MNGFEWLETLPMEQQDQLEALIAAVAEGDNERVDSMAPVLLREARDKDQPWVEILVRNFHLRSIVFNREDVREAVPQAVSLLERASRDDTRDCPQSTCVSHVLTAAYTLTDPEGFAEKREAVSRETLQGLDPERVCFLCISNEVATALIDQGRPEEALAFIEQQKEVRRSRGISFDPDDFARTESTALSAVGRHDDALKVVRAGLASGEVLRGESWMHSTRQVEAWILAESGSTEEALAQLPDLAQVFRDGGFEIHRRLVVRLVRSGQVGPAGGAVRLARLAREALQRGLADTGIQASLQSSRWFHEGGHPLLAEAVRERARPHLEALADPGRYLSELSALSELERVEPHESSIAALLAQPASPEQHVGLAERWSQMGFPDRADAALDEATRQFPDDIDLYEARCKTALGRRDAELLDRLVAAPPRHPEGEDNARFYEGLFAHETGDVARAIAAFEQVWSRRHDWIEVARRLGRLLLPSDPGRSMLVWLEAADAHQVPYFRWLGLVAATLAEDWPAQARLGAELELPELPDDRRPELDWGVLRIRIPDVARPLLARRTGPVTARILSLLGPGVTQHHGEVVVFDPQIANADEVAEDDEALRLHEAWARLEPATHDCVTLDGIWPGDEAVEALTEALDQAGVHYQFAAGDGYAITDPDGGEVHRGLFLFLAVDDASQGPLRALLEAHRPEHGPWVMHELLDRLGAADEAEEQRGLAEAWGMI
ncbi:MAG: hypothetical protein H6735_14300 [Alphaproteobacteria bacterium]|nr:hypothetical protein [Alphaproteobacteria bacterium]